MKNNNNIENRLDLSTFFNEALAIIGLGDNPFFKTRDIAEKVIEKYIECTEDFKFLKSLLSRRIGRVINKLRRKGYIEKFSNKCWRRVKKFSPQDVF